MPGMSKEEMVKLMEKYPVDGVDPRDRMTTTEVLETLFPDETEDE